MEMSMRGNSAKVDLNSNLTSELVPICVKNISKCYHIYNKPHQRLIQTIIGSKKKLYKDFWALKDVSFEVKQGETLGIIGLNGSGKSTLLQIICGTLSPTRGDVEVNGRLSALLELGAGFNPQFTGRENVYVNGALMGIKKDEMDKRIAEIEAFAEIGDFIDQPVKTYSSGMFVRLAFASAINVDPDILVIDEALSVGDMVFQHRCMTKIQELKRKKVILFVSHDIASVLNFCDRVMWLNGGKLENIGDPKAVAQQYRAYANERSVQYVMHTYTAKKNSSFWGLGDGSAQISKMSILNVKGDAVSYLELGDVINLEVIIECVRDIAVPVVGFRVQDRLGNVVFSTDTGMEGVEIPKLASGATLLTVFSFSWPLTAPGSYSFSSFIQNKVEDKMCDCVNDALVLQCARRMGSNGLIKLNDVKTSFELKPKDESLIN